MFRQPDILNKSAYEYLNSYLRYNRYFWNILNIYLATTNWTSFVYAFFKQCFEYNINVEEIPSNMNNMNEIRLNGVTNSHTNTMHKDPRQRNMEYVTKRGFRIGCE